MIFPPLPQYGDQTIVSGNLYLFLEGKNQNRGVWHNMSQGSVKYFNNPPPPPPSECKTIPQTIQIKRSAVAEAPESLAEGELAYSFASNKLFIGNKDGVPVKIP